MAALVELDELVARIEWTLSEEEERVATGALNDASELVRFYGLNWTADNVPPLVKSIVLAAATRYLRNPDGYIQSRAGDESVGWSHDAATAYVTLTKSEQEILGRMAGRGGIASVPLNAWGTVDRSDRLGYVTTDPPGKLFPFFPTGDGPW